MVTVSVSDYKHYGACLRIGNGRKDLIVTTDVGPRIIFYGFCGGENIFYEDAEDLINKDGAFFEENLRGKGIWHIYGGHRLWKSPEYMDTYYPDNAPVTVVPTANGAAFIAPVEETTKLQKTVTVTMAENGDVTVEHAFRNCGSRPTDPIALWGLSVLEKGAVAEIALPTEDTGLLPNRNISLWSYTDIRDQRLSLEQDRVVLRQTNTARPIKVGVYTPRPLVVTVRGMRFTVTTETPEGAVYPDNNCNVETYTNEIMLELETLSPLCTLEPNAVKTHTEHWSLSAIQEDL